MSITGLLKNPPKYASEFLKQKGNVASWSYLDIEKEAHAKAFTVAKAIKMDILQDIRNAIQDAIDNGLPFSTFKKSLKPILQKKGWWGKKEDIDTETGEVIEYQLGSLRRLKTIYHTNLSTAYAAGRWKSATDGAKYLQYISMDDPKVRASHKALNGKIFPIDDPFWDTFYPPNDWGCRCIARPVTESYMRRTGIKAEPSAGKVGTATVTLPTGEVKGVSVYNSGAGIKTTTGAGWNYNVGKVTYQPNTDKYDYNIAVQYVLGSVNGPDFQRFIESKGATAKAMPVAVITEEQRKFFSDGVTPLETQTVLLSKDTLLDHLPKHPEIGLKEYKRVQEIIDNAFLVIEGDKERLCFARQDGQIYFTALKTTKNKKELYCLSIHIANEGYVDRLIKKAKEKNRLVIRR